MVSSKQKQEIEEHLKRINDARKTGSKEDIERRTNELMNYLESEGIINMFDE